MGGLIGGGGKKNPGTTTFGGPWAPSAPYMKDIFKQAAGLYNKGVGGRYFPGATYIPQTANETAGLGMMQNAAMSGNPMLAPALSQGASMLSGGGMSAEQRAALSPLQDIASGRNALTSVGIGEGNPYLMKNLGIAADQARDSAGAMFSAGGRYGGGAHQGTVANEIGNLYSQGLGAQMNADLDRRMQIEGANIANQAGASNSLQGAYDSANRNALAWGALSPTLNNMRYDDANQLIKVGSAQRSDLQGQLDDNVQRWNATQNRPWEQLDRFRNVISGGAALGSTTTQPAPRESLWSKFFGGAATTAGLLGSLTGKA